MHHILMFNLDFFYRHWRVNVRIDSCANELKRLVAYVVV